MAGDAVDQLGLAAPIFGFSHCGDVVAAVSKAGGKGVYGAGLHSDEQIAVDLAWIEAQLNDAPYGIDVLLPSRYIDSEVGGLAPAAAKAAVPAEVTHFLEDLMVRYDVPELPNNNLPEDDFTALGAQRYSAKQAAGILKIASDFHPRLIASAWNTI